MTLFLPKVYLGVEWLGDILLDNLEKSKNVGAVVTFTGVVRSAPEDGGVVFIEYEAYQEMAIKEMEKLREEVLKKFPVEDIYVYHRIGRVEVGEPSFLVVTVGRHRKETFEACIYAVDSFKERVPIWKKEFRKEGESRWVRNR